MRQECLDIVSQELGRKLTPAEGNAIVSNIKNAMGALRRQDPARWSTLPHDDRIAEAAVYVATQIKDAAEQRKTNLVKQAMSQVALTADMERLAREEDIHAYAGVATILQNTYARARGIQNEYLTSMLDTINGIGSKFMGFMEDAEDSAAFVREAFGEDTGNEKARRAWEAFSNTAEAMRQRAVNAGAEIGKLDYGYIPQSHDWWKIRAAGKQRWIDDILPLLDRERFTNADGDAMSTDQLRALLDRAFDDIVTSGNPDGDLNAIAQSIPASGNNPRYKKYPHRVLHFKDASSYIRYEATYGKGSLTSSLIGHVAKMSNDIALLEVMGPKPQASFNFLKTMAEMSSQNARASESSWRLLTKYSDWQGLTDASVDDMWNVLTGLTSHAAVNREGVAQFMSGWRNLNVAGKLGKAFISSFSDIPSYFIATGFNRLPFMEALHFYKVAYGKEWKDYAARTGFIAESIISDFDRWGGDNIGQGWTSKVAQATMRLSFLNAFTDATRRAFSLTMMSGFAKMIKKSWADLDDYDRARLTEGGISERDWELLRQAGTETHKGIEFLTIRQLKTLGANPNVQATEGELEALPGKFLGFIIRESEMASLNPDLVTRAETTRGEQRGTLKGELARAVFMFKSFPLAMMERHFRRARFLAKHGGGADQLRYVCGMLVATTVMGAISLETADMLSGKDPRSPDNFTFWANAFAKGGGAGFLGDYLANGLSEDARYGAMSGLTNFAGPIVGDVVDVSDLITSMAGSAIYDKETKPAARAVRIVRSHTPFVNMWWTSAAIDHAFMNELQEYLSPGYLSRREKRLRRSTGQGYWWKPQDDLPARAPRVAPAPKR